MDLVTVIVPVYNVEKYLEKCVESIINQTYFNLEIILVNDGSTDNSGKICDKFKEKDKRIKVIHKENGGLSDARNVAIDIAKGRYLTFVDSDDFINLKYIEYLKELVDKNNADISTCKVKLVWKNVKINELEDSNKIVEEKVFNAQAALENIMLEQGMDMCACGKLYKRELFENIRYPVGKAYEDSATTYKVIDLAKRIVFGAKDLYYYIPREGSISRKTFFNKNDEDYLMFTKEMFDFINGKYKELEFHNKRYFIYSRFRVLRNLIYTTPRLKEIEKKCIKEIDLYKYEVLKDKRTPKRDKFAIISLFGGIISYKICWNVYKKITGRI